ISLFFIFFLYSYILRSSNNITDMYQPLRFLRCIVNTVGVASLLSLYVKHYESNAGTRLVKDLWFCLLFHAVIITIMFLVPPVNEFIIMHVRKVDPNSEHFKTLLDGNRIGGLTASWDATSGMQSLGIILLPAFWVKGYKNIFMVLGVIFFSLFSMFLSGATGFITLALNTFFITFLWPNRAFNAQHHSLIFNIKAAGKRINRTINIKFNLLLTFLLTIMIISYVVINILPGLSLMISGTSIARTTNMFLSDTEYELKHNNKRTITANRTIKTIMDMYFLPSETDVFLFGLGGSGRKDNEYYIPADNGIILNVHNLGIIMSLLLYCFILYDLCVAFKYRHKLPQKSFITLFVMITILLIDAKVQYLIARNSLSIMLIAVFTMWHEIGLLKFQRRKQLQKDKYENKICNHCTELQ
ncbi:MAG: hypothetical protein ACOC3T_00500, partial [Bacteroidota bacterium]